jgi:hypothetical protein
MIQFRVQLRTEIDPDECEGTGMNQIGPQRKVRREGSVEERRSFRQAMRAFSGTSVTDATASLMGEAGNRGR